MRAKLVLAGLVAGLATSFAPAGTAYCEPEIFTTGEPSGGCRNSCVETGHAYEEARLALENKTGVRVLPSYWNLFACPM